MKRVSEITQQIQVNGFGKGDKKQTLVEYVYQTKRTHLWKVEDCDIRFKDGSPYMPTNTCYVMAVPIVQKSDKTILGIPLVRIDSIGESGGQLCQYIDLIGLIVVQVLLQLLQQYALIMENNPNWHN
ncbi:unnamed protein product [Medioppia subpectinata]|uniref:Uncharacterized protein n=1 Tax=Medioppia subpectinata TaxID=1979941 RepID=A0A7R9KYB9_9ACAR|nr:unnamed protein product [Medioppia subpectinata]CAG2112128.1 unnamed protein product [Medioppia subpectinata]